jgi:hypothetical protein
MNQQQYLDAFQIKLKLIGELTARKNKDYASDADPFANFTLTEKMGNTTTAEGIVVRMTDKLQRVSNLLKRKAVVSDERISDTLMDLAVYSLILSIYLENQNEPAPTNFSTIESTSIRRNPFFRPTLTKFKAR